MLQLYEFVGLIQGISFDGKGGDGYYMAVEGKSSNNKMVVLSIRGNVCYLEAKPESGYIWKPYKQKLG